MEQETRQSVQGQRVLIVGGGGEGNGRAITRTLGAAGANVAVVDLQPTRAQEAADELISLGGNALGLAGDVCNSDDIERVVAGALDFLGGLDVLITVVGGSTVYVPRVQLHETTDEQWDLIFDVNLRYVFRFVRSALRVFLAQSEGGTIVSIGSIAGITGQPLVGHYAAAKAGLVSLAKTVATGYGRRGIRMNVISCGIISTPSVRLAWTDDYGASVPLGRPGEAQEVADLALFLASPMSSYLSGQNVVLDGALTVQNPLPNPDSDARVTG